MAAAGASLSNILQITVYLVKISEYGRFNEVYEKYFHQNHPARTCVQVDKLPFGLRVEIDGIGFVGSRSGAQNS